MRLQETDRVDYLRFLIRSDLYRYAGRGGFGCGVKCYFNCPGFRFTLLIRVYQWLRPRRWRWIVAKLAVALLLRRYTFKFGFDISPDLKVGSGLYIGHFGGVVINQEVVIGDNCNLSHGVTLGQINRGGRVGSPIIGNNVYIGPGAKIIGRIQIGNGAAVGANAVVVDDVPEGTVVAGVPAKVISNNGSAGYVNRTDYPPYSRK